MFVLSNACGNFCLPTSKKDLLFNFSNYKLTKKNRDIFKNKFEISHTSFLLNSKF